LLARLTSLTKQLLAKLGEPTLLPIEECLIKPRFRVGHLPPVQYSIKPRIVHPTSASVQIQRHHRLVNGDQGGAASVRLCDNSNSALRRFAPVQHFQKSIKLLEALRARSAALSLAAAASCSASRATATGVTYERVFGGFECVQYGAS